MSEPRDLLTVDEVGELLKLHPQTVRNWIDRGKLGAVRLGSRRVRVRWSHPDAFVEGRGCQASKRGDTSLREHATLEPRLERLEAQIAALHEKVDRLLRDETRRGDPSPLAAVAHAQGLHAEPRIQMPSILAVAGLR